VPCGPAAVVLLLGVGACQSPPGPIFPQISPPIVWPRPPDRPRIRYIGELTGQASLGVKPRGWSAVKAVFEGPPPEVAFTAPSAVAVRGERVYVADGQLGVIHVLNLETRVFSVIAQAGGAALQGPIDVTLTGDELAVADSRRAAVYLFRPDGTYVRSVGEGVLQRPASLAWRNAASELWVSDAALHQCLVFDAAGTLKRRIGQRGPQPGQFNFPAGLTWREPLGAVLADAMNFRVQMLDAAGNAVSSFGQLGDAAGDFALPRDVAVDSAGHIYVLDNRFENVQIFDPGGQLLMAFGQEGQGPGEFCLPSGITIDERDRIWIADTYNRRVQVFQYIPEDVP
jgi:DNA-binding beta-propeller fold protein YncE